MTSIRDISVERIDADVRKSDNERVVIEAPLQLRARGTPVATIMRTPGNDLELARGLLHAESIRTSSGSSGNDHSSQMRGDGASELRLEQVDDDAVEIDVDASAFAERGLLSSAACGVCGRVAIADLELRAREVSVDTMVDHRVIAALPDKLRTAQAVFADTGGLHAAGLFTTDGTLLAAREDVGRHNAVDKLVGWALGAGRGVAGGAGRDEGALDARRDEVGGAGRGEVGRAGRAERALDGGRDEVGGAGRDEVGGAGLLVQDAGRGDVGSAGAAGAGLALGSRVDASGLVLMLSGRAGYELVQKAIMFGVPVVASVSAPSSLAVELAERFNVALVGFVRGTRMNVYSHGWRIL